MGKVKRWFIIGLITTPLLFSGGKAEGAVIKGVLSNFDLHNFTGGMVNDLEVILAGIACTDIKDYFHGRGYPPDCIPQEGGVMIRWKFEDNPLKYCEWGHFGVELKEGAKQPLWGWAIWTFNGEPIGDPIPFPWQRWEGDTACYVYDIIIGTPQSPPVFVSLQWAISDEVIPLDSLTPDNPMVEGLDWHPSEPRELAGGDSLVTQIGPTKPGDAAVLVMYEVALVEAPDSIQSIFVNEAVIEPCGPPPEDMFDFGDAPDGPYPSLLASNGARHHNKEGEVYKFYEWLGDIWYFIEAQRCDTVPQVDVELDSRQVDKDSPNTPPGPDDGIRFYPPYDSAPGESLDVLISTSCMKGQRYGPTQGLLYFNGWFDWNRDGDWDDPREHIYWLRAKPIAPMSGPAFPVNDTIFAVDPSQWKDCCQLYRLYFNSHTTKKPGDGWEWKDSTWTRFRLSYREKAASVKGVAQWGEVEDYIVAVKPPVEPGVGEKPKSSTYLLTQNSPNPFNLFTSIKYGLPVDGWINLSVYNALGERVKVLIDRRAKAGVYEIEWDGYDEEGKKLPSGIYFYRLTTEHQSITKAMVLLR